MRKGWDLVKLGSLCDIQNGFAFDSKLFNNDGKGLPLIRIRDIKRGYSETFTTEECDNAYVVKDGDYLIGMDGEFNIGQWKSENALLNQRVCKLLPSSKILPRFIYYYIPKALKDIEDKTAYATVKHLSSKQIKEIHIPNISIPEQQRIVEILDREFAKIDALKANAEKSLQAAKDLFQAALTHYFSEGNVMLGDILNLHRGYDLTHREMADGPIPVAGSGGIIGYHNVATPISPCITIGRSGSIGKVFMYETCWAHNTSLYVDDFKGNNPFYLVYLLKSLDLPSFGGGSAVPTLNRNVLHPVVVGYTSDKIEQEKIVLKLDDLNDKCNILQENCQKTLTLCDDLKQSLLRKAFNGEL